jgi:hypothetical protein
MKAHKYVVVCSDGTSHDMGRQELFTEYGKPKKGGYDLLSLLKQGWVPVRETAMGGGEYQVFALVLLEKDEAS